jgi:hypothetical protein
MNIEEVLGPNLPKEMRPHRMEPRFVSWLPGAPISDPTSYPDAVSAAIALGYEGCVGFLSEEPAPPVATKLDYSQPLPEIMSRTKRGGRK